MHKTLTHLAASLALCGVIAPLYAGTAAEKHAPPPTTPVKVKSFRIIGSRAFSEAELLKLVNDATGKELSSADISELANRITLFYRKHGFLRAHAIIPPQNFYKGEVRFIVTKSIEPSKPSSAPSTPGLVPGGGDDPASLLLRRATWWTNHDRDDLAMENLDKLLNIVPNHPDGLVTKAELEIKMQKMDSAQATLNTLKQTHPNHPAISRIETLIRVYGHDRAKLRHALQLAHGRSSEIQKALAAFREIFPDGPPEGDLALEYWKLIADSWNGWKQAHDGLSRLVREFPDNQRYRLRLAELESYRYPGHYPVDRKSLRVIVEIAKMPDVKIPEFEKPAKEVWSYTLLRRSPSPEDLPLLEEYLAFDPDNTAIKERRRLIILAREQQRRLLADPNYKAGIEGVAFLNKGQLEKAEPLLEQALQARPEDADLTGEMGLLRLRQGRHAEAQAFFDRALQLTHGSSNEWKSLIKISQFWKLMQEAREARKARDFDLAENKLNAALQVDSNKPDAYALIGDVQVDRGHVSAAAASYRHALSLDPLNNGALEGLIAINRRQSMTQAQHFISELTPAQRNVVSQTINRMEIEMVEEQVTDEDNFLPALEQIPADKRPANISRLWGENLEKLANAHAQSGRKVEAEHLLQEAERIAENDEEASLAVATAWGKLGEYKHADSIFGKLKTAHTPPSVRWYFRHADYLAMKNAPELPAELAVLAAMPSLTPDETQRLHTMQESLALQTAQAQLAAGKPALVHQTLEPFLKISPDHTALLLVNARAYQAEENWSAAESAYARILQLEPSDNRALRGSIEAQIALGNRAEALAQLDEWAADPASSDAYGGIQKVDLYLALNEPGRAQKQLDILLAKYPNDPQVLNEAWQMAQRDQRLDDEITYLKKAFAAEKTEGLETSTPPPLAPDAYQKIGFDELGSPHKIQRDWKEKKLAALIDERSEWLSSAVDIRTHSGTPGLSQSSFTEIPVEYKRPWHTNDEIFFRTDIVKLDAGTTDPTSTTFGRMLFCQQPSAACSAALLPQHAEGKSLTAGYISSNLHADIGVTPLEFSVSNFVGGVRYNGDYKLLGYSLEASRRPVTDSLLSYAGTRDPATGQIWGGVVSTGVRLGLSLDEGKAFGFWSSAGLHILTGNNVLTNQQLQLMAGEQWRLINENNRLFSVGLTGMYWLDSKDAGEYTFGHGGYYSPQNYRSLSLPVTYGARYPRFSYVLRGAVSVTQSQTQSADYFPTDSVLQAQAKALTTTNFITPVYSSSGESTSTGYSLEGIGEYQLNQKLFVGGMLSIARSVNYTPNRLLLYLRYSLDHDAAQPVYFQPRPVEPSSHF